MNTPKEYYEDLALRTLRHFVSHSFDEYVRIDRPDLQNVRLKIGVEVVRGISSSDGLYDSFVKNEFNKDNSDEYLVQKAAKQKVKMILLKDESFRAITAGTGCNTERKRIFARRVNDKIRKSANYEGFTRVDIYVFCEFSIFNIRDFMEVGNNIVIDGNPRNVYFDCVNRIFELSLPTKSIRCLEFDMSIRAQDIQFLDKEHNVH